MLNFNKILILFCFFFINSFQLFADIKVDDLIAKIEKAADPEHIGSTIKSQLRTVEISFPGKKLLIHSITVDKYPDKSKTITQISSGLSYIVCCDGKEGWKCSNATEIVSIPPAELAKIKFDIFMRNPAHKLKDIFSKFTIASNSDLVGALECYKLVCVPKNGFCGKSFTLWIDKNQFLIRKMVFIMNVSGADVRTETLFSDYKIINKIPVATSLIIQQGDLLLIAKVLDIKNNVDVSDTEFQKPAKK